MRNRWLEREQRRGEVWDVSRCKRRTRDGDYVLPRKMYPPKRAEGRDYADIAHERYVWSIGRNKRTGAVIASLSGKFYQRPGWDCLWLR